MPVSSTQAVDRRVQGRIARGIRNVNVRAVLDQQPRNHGVSRLAGRVQRGGRAALPARGCGASRAGAARRRPRRQRWLGHGRGVGALKQQRQDGVNRAARPRFLQQLRIQVQLVGAFSRIRQELLPDLRRAPFQRLALIRVSVHAAK